MPDKTPSDSGEKDQKNKEDLFMGKVGFSPIIGLAVVVALAMVAVFGAMSLANPAACAVRYRSHDLRR